ncbi:MAG TPA: hypothetical protein ENH40_02885 [Nitrospirae bacterium]|nr:hypothetical protein [Nitrospirota bacterium]
MPALSVALPIPTLSVPTLSMNCNKQMGNRQQMGNHGGGAPTMSLSDVMHRFKTLTTKRYTDGVKNNDWPRFNKKLWQRNYYEHIIRDENSYYQISEYIQTNPLKWQDDKYHA